MSTVVDVTLAVMFAEAVVAASAVFAPSLLNDVRTVCRLDSFGAGHIKSSCVQGTVISLLNCCVQSKFGLENMAFSNVSRSDMIHYCSYSHVLSPPRYERRPVVRYYFYSIFRI